jgi:hypothetical protein
MRQDKMLLRTASSRSEYDKAIRLSHGRGGSGRSLDSPEGQCGKHRLSALGFQPVFSAGHTDPKGPVILDVFNLWPEAAESANAQEVRRDALPTSRHLLKICLFLVPFVVNPH